ncbi:OLC1v1021565C1 [Oldenlandia corymbosa var. corymbosa]|uniref:OLC1v1021565C1 n=1 Tax=Oldenlandia corymbosa var. corymbosa TaxID=529605 RepID=A0AAV1BYJ4_OLDCO|nr:OLC1v1021565C1 [Oldenlandia corymbosa var. corymbosa]
MSVLNYQIYAAIRRAGENIKDFATEIYAAIGRAGENIKDFATAFGLSTMTRFVSKIRTKSQRCLKLEKMWLKEVCYESSNKEKHHPCRMKIMLKNCCGRRGKTI